MKVFELDVPEKTTLLVGSDPESVRQLGRAGKGAVGEWSRVDGEIDETYLDRVAGPQDMPWVNSGALVLPDDTSSLAAYLRQFGELLPVTTPRQDVWVFNARTIVEGALDSASTVEYIPGTRKVLDVHAWVFVEEAIQDHHLFRVAEIPNRLLIDDEAADEIQRSGLTGPHLREVWRA